MYKTVLKTTTPLPVESDHAYGDWPANAMPPAVTWWISECRVTLKRALCSRSLQDGCLRAGMKVRNGGGPTTSGQEQEIRDKLARGDRVREMADQWHAQHRAMGGTRTREDVICSPGKLSLLASLGLMPRIPDAIRAWMQEQRNSSTWKRPVDLDQREAEATAAVAAGSWG